jgi:hypothetical protein
MAARLRSLLHGGTAAAAALTILSSCASILGYNDLEERHATDAAVTPETDTAPIPEVAVDVADVQPDVPGVVPIHPPSRPTGAAVASGKGKTLWLIAKRFYLGTNSLAGTPSKDAWKDLGFDIDHVCTGQKESRENIGTCQRVAGALQDVLIDGSGCRDNNFGSQLVPLIQLYDSVFEDESNTAIAQGNNSWIIKIEDLDDGPDDPYAPGMIYKAVNYSGMTSGKAPKFDGTDVREVDSSSIVAGDVTKAKTSFALGYVKDNVWVSGDGGDFDAPVPINTIKAQLTLIGAVMTVKISDDHNSAGLSVLSGGIPGSRLEEILRPVAAGAGFCPGSALYNSLLKTVAQQLDLVEGAPHLQNTSVVCDSLSVGIAFEAAPIQPVTTALTPAPSPDPCGDAGT